MKKTIITIISLLILMIPFVLGNGLLNGLVSYYQFDGNSSDSTSTNNLVNGHGSPTYRTGEGILNGAYYYDDDAFDMGIVFPTSGDFTYCLWYNMTSHNPENWQGLFGNQGSGQDNTVLWTDTSHDYYFYSIETGSATDSIQSGIPPVLNEWYHACSVIYSNESIIMGYINGEFVGSGDYNYPDSVQSNIYIGGLPSYPTTHGLEGLIDEFGYWNRSLNQTLIQTLYNGNQSLSYYDFNYFSPPTNNKPIIDWDNHEPLNNSNVADTVIDVNFNCSDFNNDTLSYHLELNGVNVNSSYNNLEGLNTTLSISGLNDGYNNITLLCDDNIDNSTDEKFIFLDSVEPFIFFINPSVNGTNYEIDFNSQINISDTNLYSSNVTTYNSTNDIQYTNYTEDYNTTDEVLINEQDISSFVGGTYDICIEVCDAHTMNKLPKELTYIIDGNKLEVAEVPITFNGEIKELKITELEDRYKIQLDLYQTGEYTITLDQCFDMVSSTDYYGHYVCHEKQLWFDTMPFQVNYIIKDQYGRHVLYMTAEEKEVKFDSVGVINCKSECIQYTGDADEPDSTLILPLNNHITQNETIGFQFNYSHPPPDKVVNCTVEIDGIQNESVFGSPYLSSGTTYEIEVENLFDTQINRTIDWSVNCTDESNHVGNEAMVWELEYQTNISTPPTTPITTGEAIIELKESFDDLLLFGIWIILFIASLLFYKYGVFAIMVMIYGITLGIIYEFDNMTMRMIFIIFNIMYFTAMVFSYLFIGRGNDSEK